MKKNKYLDLIEISVIAALYVVLTIVVQPISFGEIQFRLSEVLMFYSYTSRFISWTTHSQANHHLLTHQQSLT